MGAFGSAPASSSSTSTHRSSLRAHATLSAFATKTPPPVEGAAVPGAPHQLPQDVHRVGFAAPPARAGERGERRGAEAGRPPVVEPREQHGGVARVLDALDERALGALAARAARGRAREGVHHGRRRGTARAADGRLPRADRPGALGRAPARLLVRPAAAAPRRSHGGARRPPRRGVRPARRARADRGGRRRQREGRARVHGADGQLRQRVHGRRSGRRDAAQGARRPAPYARRVRALRRERRVRRDGAVARVPLRERAVRARPARRGRGGERIRASRESRQSTTLVV
eukprot:scaffold177612_cov28-Tisochrysis_lutea.AAC.1